VIKSQLAAQMGLWQARHNEALLIPDLADKTGLSRDFLYRLYRDDIQRLDLDKLEILCRFFGCSPDDLIWLPDTDLPAADSSSE